MTDELTYQLIDVSGRGLVALWSDGTVLPVARGGDEGEGGQGAGGEGAGDGSQGTGTGTGTGGQGSGEGAGGEGGQGEGGDGGQDKPITMTQADLDALIDKRLGRAKTQWEKDAKTEAERAQMDETERLKVEKADADARADAATEKAKAIAVRAAAKVAALDAKAKPDRVDALLRLVDLTDVDVDDDGEPDTAALTKAVTKGLEDFPEFKAPDGPPPPPGRSGGDMNGGGNDTPAVGLDAAVAKALSGAAR